MTNVVYVVGPGDGNEQLRYSLRSLQNLPHDRVWIVGHCPPWLRNVEKIAVPQTGSKHANTWANWEALAAAGPESMLVFNDDFFAVRPAGPIPVWHRGPLDARIRHYEAAPGLRAWAQRARWTRAALRRLGRDPDSLMSYELHLPLPIEREQLAAGFAALQRARTGDLEMHHKRTFIANWANLGGTEVRDCKVHSKYGSPPRGAFVSTSRLSWKGTAGAWIRARFRKAGPYED